MNKIFRILQVDLRQTGLTGLQTIATMAILFIYFYLIGNRTFSLSGLLMFGQMFLVYMICNRDISQTLPTYISMSCTRKNITVVIVIRWIVVFFTVVLLNTLIWFFQYPELLSVKMYITLISSFLLILGLCAVFVIVHYYNHFVGLLFNFTFAVLVGIGSYLFVSADGSASVMGDAINGLSNGSVSGFLIAALIVFVGGSISFVLHLGRYSVR